MVEARVPLSLMPSPAVPSLAGSRRRHPISRKEVSVNTTGRRGPSCGLPSGLCRIVLVLALFVAAAAEAVAGGVGDAVSVRGPQRMLVVAVRFPGTAPGLSLPQIEEKAGRVDRYLRAASYGKTWLGPRLVGWYDMPSPIEQYRVSPFNYQVDRGRVRRLLADALGAARRESDPLAYDVVWIVVGVRTRPGEGYGMIAYCANPGMLSGVRRGRAALETVELPGGGSFSGPAIVSAENAHVGHIAHDLLHALGGARDGRRVVPDLYDFDMQSDPRIFKDPPGRSLHPSIFSIYAGPWDIMSQHFIEVRQAPPPPSSFTRLQLGWIDTSQGVAVRPGETWEVTLQPLALGKGALVVRVPAGEHRYLLLENRQRVGGDAVLPAAGLLVLEIDTTREEGAGIVRVADANPATPHLNGAPFVPGAGERRSYVSRAGGVAIAPLAMEAGGALRLIVTTPEKIGQWLTGAAPQTNPSQSR